MVYISLDSLLSTLKSRQLEAIKEGLDEKAVEDMIEIAKSIAHDYEHGFERTKDEKACGECGYGLYCGACG